MRKPRELITGARYHVIARVNRKELIFKNRKTKDMILSVLKKAKKKFKITFYNFCIMGNHLHIILKPHNEYSLSKIMQWILSVFAVRYNRSAGLQGHLWYDRFTSKVIRSLRQYVTTFVYIANNPVRAGLVTKCDQFEYNGITFIKKGNLDLLERPPTAIASLLLGD